MLLFSNISNSFSSFLNSRFLDPFAATHLQFLLVVIPLHSPPLPDIVHHAFLCLSTKFILFSLFFFLILYLQIILLFLQFLFLSLFHFRFSHSLLFSFNIIFVSLQFRLSSIPASSHFSLFQHPRFAFLCFSMFPLTSPQVVCVGFPRVLLYLLAFTHSLILLASITFHVFFLHILPPVFLCFFTDL